MKRFSNILMCSAIVFAVMLLSCSAIAQNNWQSLGSPSVGSANVTDLVAGRTGTYPTVYSAQGSTIYRSTDGAVTWTTTTQVNGTPLALTCKQSTPSYVVTHFRDASSNGNVWYSLDNGTTWQPTNVNDNPAAIAIRMAAHPADQLKMFMGEEKFNGFCSMKRSVDAGRTWDDVSYFFGSVQTDVVALAPHKTNANHVFAGGTTPPPGGRMSALMGPLSEPPPVYQKGGFFSIDGGVNWNRFTSYKVDSNIVAMAAYKKTGYSTNYIFAATEHGVLYRASYTSNPSTSEYWTKMTNFPAGIDVNDLTVDGNNVIYAATSTGCWKSTDHGSSWASISGSMANPSNLERAALDPQTASSIFVGSPTNLYQTTDAGCTWRDAAPTSNPVNAVSAVASNGATLLTVPTGYSAMARNTGSGWSTFSFAPITDFVGRMVGFKSSDGIVALDVGYRSSSNTASLLRNGNNGDNTCGNVWEEKRWGSTIGGKYNGFVTDPANTDRVYAFGLIQNGNATTNENYSIGISGGTSWERKAFPYRTNISEIADFSADSTNHGTNNYSLVLYAAITSTATGDQGVWKSVNGGISWTNKWNQPVRALGFNPKVASTIRAAGSGTALYTSTNSGEAWTTSNTLPGEVSRLLMHPTYPTSSNYFWIIKGDSIYKTADGGTNWKNVTGNLPTPITDIRSDITSTVLIYAATSNGVWKINPAPEAPVGLSVGIYRWCPCPYPPGCIQQQAPEGEGGGGGGDPCPWAQRAQVNWSANAEVDGSTYTIFRSTSPDGGFVQIASVSYTTSSYIDYDVSLPNATTYYYKMVATDAAGNVSDTSAVVNTSGLGKGVFTQ